MRRRCRFGFRTLAATLALAAHFLDDAPLYAREAAPAEAVRWATDVAELVVAADGTVAALRDRRSGADYLRHDRPLPLARLRRGSHVALPRSATATAEGVRLDFDDGAQVDLQVAAQPGWLTFTVARAELPDKPADAAETTLEWLDLPLTLAGKPDEPAAACLLALNLQTRVDVVPQAATHLQAWCFERLGLVGGQVALVCCPPAELRATLKQAVAAADSLPQSPIGGPWALDAPANRGSYVLDCTGATGLANIDAWIAALQELGIDQLDFHCGRCLRFGDYTPHPDVHPQGLASVRAMTDRLHAAGMLAGLHTYAFFIAKDSPFVTPTPDPGLAVAARFRLQTPLSAEATEIDVVESTADVSNVTGFFIRNSVTLRIDDELIVFSQPRTEAPYGFAKCQRGACGTQPAPHAAGAEVAQLKECLGMFVPDPSQPLWDKVLDATATAYNEGGFDMIYLDALDCSDIFAGGEWAWHYGSKFVFELHQRLHKPALFEMSTFHHHLWYVRSRMGAWDSPQRAPRPFVEIHRMTNEKCRQMFLPAHLGWWALHDWQGLQPDRSYPETLEYLLARCVADDCGLSLLAIAPPETFGPKWAPYAELVRRYEALRRSGRASAELRRRLGEPFAEHALVVEASSDAPVRFRPAHYDRRCLEGLDVAEQTCPATNRFGRQPLAVRIEPLLSHAAYDDAATKLVEDFADLAAFARRQAPDDAHVTLEAAPGGVQFTARPAVGGPTWAMVGRQFDPPLDLRNAGLGLWIEGDGSGAVLNVQLKSPLHALGGVCDRHVKLDFRGRRYVALVEPAADAIVDYSWPYMPSRAEWRTLRRPGMGEAYPAFHIGVAYDQIAELNLWLNDVPPTGTSCVLGPIRALPLSPGKLRHPTLRLGDRTLRFPVELSGGEYLECRGPDACRVHDAGGKAVAHVQPEGDWLEMQPGDNDLRLTVESDAQHPVRAAITVMTFGEAFAE